MHSTQHGPRGIDLHAPGGVEALLRLHASVFGDARMLDEGGDSGSGDAGQTGGQNGGQNGGGTGGDGGGSGPQNGEQNGGRADLGRAGGEQRVVAELAQEREARRRLEGELEQLRRVDDERRRADEAESTRRVRTELEAQVATATSQVGELRAQLIVRDALEAAVTAGVARDRWAAFSRHVDLDALAGQVGADGTVPGDALTAAITAGLEEAPEFRTTSAPRGRVPVPGSGAGAGQPLGDVQAATAAAVARMRRHLGQPVTDGAS